ncbi:MAG: pyruvate kinase [Bacilli bacterium]|jgi:pyruvate kinase|nr:pyruvate kinase [Bacilli bacterium]
MRKTKIICTLGPAVDQYSKLKKLVLAGMDAARLNFSHGDHQEQLGRIEKIKQLRKELGLSIPIILDTKGPEIRLYKFEKDFIEIEENQEFTFYGKYETIGNEQGIGTTCSHLYEDVHAGNTILVDDGKVAFEVIRIEDNNVICKALNSGKLSNKKSMNIPNVVVKLPYMSDKDKADLLFGIEQGIDFIAASFTRTAADLLEMRAFLDSHKGNNIRIFAKIENAQGIKNADDIIKVADGIMVARGDMGVEIPFNELPIIQKELIKKCYRSGKHVITATQMLESMTKNPRPTRAEVSDVANAIYDGTTIIMLSGETAMGDYPVESVKAMAMIAETTEQSINYKKRFETNHLDLGFAVMSAIANAAVISANQINAKAIIAVTRKGTTARSIANYRPNTFIIAATADEKSFHQLRLAWNTYPILINSLSESIEEAFDQAIDAARQAKMITTDDMIVLAGGVNKSNLQTGILKIHKA